MEPVLSLEAARGVLASQPFSQLLGTQLEVFESGRAVLSLPVSSHLLQQHGFVHGGVLSYLADNALTFAGGSVLGDALTAEFKLNYLRPAVGGGRLRADARVLGQGRTQAVVRCDVSLVDETGSARLCVAAQGTIRRAER